ncbi:hypothetical protein chiPu_0024910, partial [Chiloscyllium punctatum]|nr:hypothetical protein [Chiloscyllium punctatum]
GPPIEQLVKDGHKQSVERPRAQAAKDVVDALRQVFLVLCEMAEGEFDIQAFRSILERLKFRLSEEAVSQAFRKLDGNEDQRVTFEDFLRAMTDDRLFVRFMAGLPDSCCDSKMQKGFLDNRVFFRVLSTQLRSQSLSEGATALLIDYYYRKKKGAKLKTRKAGEIGHPTAQSFLGVSVFNLIHYLDILEPDVGYKEQPLTPRQSQAFTEAFQALDRNERGNVDQSTLLSTMDRLKLGLDNPFIPDDRKTAAVNAGKELTFHDFLGIMADTGTFGKYLDPPEAGRERHWAPETLPFEILLENLETSSIDCDSRRILIDYYRAKYRRLEARVLELSHGCQAGGRERTTVKAAGDRVPSAPRPRAALKQQQQPPEDDRPGAGQPPKPAGDAATRRRGGREGPAANRPAPSSTETKARPAAGSSHTPQRPDRVPNTRRGQNRRPENRPAANGAHGNEPNPGPTPKPKEQ